MLNKHFIGALLLSVGAFDQAHASAALAAQHGCYNCHSTEPRGNAPSMERLASKMAKYRDDTAAQEQRAARLIRGEMFEHVLAHEQLSPETAQTLIHWLAEGGR